MTELQFASSSSTTDSHPLRSGVPNVVGIIAGNGRFPLDLAREAKKLGHTVIVAAHRGETSPEIESLADVVQWIRVGQLGAILNLFKKSGVAFAAMAGGISRLRLFGGVRPDIAGIKLIARLGTTRDDVLLRGIATELERVGISVFGAAVLLPEAIPCVGTLTKRSCTAAEKRDAEIGWEAAHAIGRLDIGQTVVVFEGLVIAVEAVEGTDATIHRAGELARGNAGAGVASVPQNSRHVANGPVVVKCAKPQQDLRVDLPTVGIGTIQSMIIAGASALVIEAGKTLLLEPAEIVFAANSAGIAISSVGTIEQLRSL